LWLVVQTATGPISPKEYQELYYRDFFNYTRERLGNDRVITARPVDSYSIPFWGPSFAPRDVNFAGWVGDQDPNWFGLNAALNNMYFSGRRGYVNFGSDIGGYRGDEIREAELFVRWAQFGAFSPIMENGGAGEHRPWMYDGAVLDVYRTFTKLHHALLPYLYSQGAAAYPADESLYRPLEKYSWHHLLGDSILVAPIAAAGGTKEVHFPDGVWIDFFTRERYAGPATEVLEFPLDRYPVFVREGAIVPLDLREGGPFAPTDDDYPPLTIDVYLGAAGGRFDVYEQDADGARIEYDWNAENHELSLSATPRGYAFRLIDADRPAAVSVQPHGALDELADLTALRDAAAGWTYDAAHRELWIKPGDAARGLIVTID
jgi:hypothetical protein